MNGCFWRSYTSGINTSFAAPRRTCFTRMPLTFMFTGTRAAISATWWSKHGSTSASLAPAPNRLSAGIRGLFGRSVVPISRGDLIFRSVNADLAKR